MNYTELATQVTAQLVAQIEAGPDGQWSMPWHRMPGLFDVRNAATGRPYNTGACGVFEPGEWGVEDRCRILDALGGQRRRSADRQAAIIAWYGHEGTPVCAYADPGFWDGDAECSNRSVSAMVSPGGGIGSSGCRGRRDGLPLCWCFGGWPEAAVVASVPRFSQAGSCEVPVGPDAAGDVSEVVDDFVDGGPTPVPVPVVDLVDLQARLEDHGVGDHWITGWVGVFGNVEVLLDYPFRVGEERPLSAETVAESIDRGMVVGGDSDDLGVADDEFGIEVDQVPDLASILGAERASEQQEDHRVVALELGERLRVLVLVWQFVVGEGRSGDNVWTHGSLLDDVVLCFSHGEAQSDYDE